MREFQPRIKIDINRHVVLLPGKQPGGCCVNNPDRFVYLSVLPLRFLFS